MSDKKVLHTLISESALSRGSAMAIESVDGSLKYETLELLSNRMSSYLLESLLSAGSIVGVYLDSGIDYVISILGINKSGYVFMPLGLSMPEKRLSGILSYVRPGIIITDRLHAEQLDVQLKKLGIPDYAPVQVVIGKDFDLRHNDSSGRFFPLTGVRDKVSAVVVDGDQMNYLLSTSGSTGTPKLISGLHKSLSHFIHWEQQEFGLGSEVRVSQLAPVTFDVSLRDIFLPLLCGGTICIPATGVRSDPYALLQWLISSRINVMHIVPSVFRLLTRSLSEHGELRDGLKDLRYIFLAGEPVYWRDVKSWRDEAGLSASLINLYGPTETTLAKLYHRIGELPEDLNAIVPLGKPINNTVALVISNNLSANIGEIGEICIKTPFRTQGYYGDEALTSEKFIQNPLHEDYKDIIYRTGDLGKYQSDGTVAFVGRQDSQVKIRGNRVELGEIEHVLSGVSGIGEVLVHPIQRGEEIVLVCYYREQVSLEAGVLQSHLKGHLPDYMHPSYYIRLEEFPYGLNGKIDKRSLPAPEELLYKSLPYEAPYGETEIALAEVWTSVLGLNRVGVTNSFFELGGHSLSATRVISRIYKQLGKEISLRDFFDHPTIRGLSELIGSRQVKAYQAISVAPRQDHYELSHAQKRIWILAQMKESKTTYNIFRAFLLLGKIDFHLLNQAFRCLVEKYESLRTVFITVNGKPKQKVIDLQDFIFNVKYQDVSNSNDAKVVADQIIEQESDILFNLNDGPLLRVQLIKLKDETFLFLFTIHHIISDGWSMNVLVTNLLEIYRTLSTGKIPVISSLRIQYKDFAHWQNAQLEVNGSQMKSYWLEQFKDGIPLLNIPTDKPRQLIKTYNGNSLKFEFDKQTTGDLIALGKTQGASLYMLLFASINILLYKYTDQHDIVLGSPIAGRNHPDTEDQIGCFVNTLALRCQFKVENTFNELLEIVKNVTLNAYKNDLYPFESLVGDLKINRDMSRSPLFDVMVVYHEPIKAVKEQKAENEIVIEEYLIDKSTVQFDLIFNFQLVGENLILNLEYNNDLFKLDRAERMLKHLTNVYSSIIKYSNIPITEINILSDAEKKDLVYNFNNTQQSYPNNKGLQQLFAETVQLYPNKVAFSHNEVSLTYAQLDKKSNQLARYLTEQYKINKDDRIGVSALRSDLLIISILGILKANCVYLPLDYNYPVERIQNIIEDAHVGLVITDGSLPGSLNDYNNTRIISLKTEWDRIEDADDNPFIDVNYSNIAYVIYTSGSTGGPKGVVVEQKALINLCYWHISTFNVNSSSKGTLFSNIGFDASIWEIWPYLIAGATLYPIDDEKKIDVHTLAYLINEKRITHSFLPTPICEMLVNASIEFDNKLTVLTGGDELKIVNTPKFRIINNYGLTETTVVATSIELNNDELNKISIGKPIANTKIYILNPQLNLQPIGVEGEICIAGISVTNGYIGKPELTKERFIDSPFEPETTLFRTGDRGRWLDNGLIEFAGRRDDQVKIRGYRIELAEIEQAILKFKNISGSVVKLIENIDKQLVAYFTSGDVIDIGALTAFLKKMLPQYMVPKYFIQLKSIPVTVNGKIDKANLPYPAFTASLEKQINARNDIEVQLSEIWKNLLGLSSVGIYDDFFESGGHSLKATQLMFHIHRNMSVKLELSSFFTHSTIESQARLIRESIESDFIFPEVFHDNLSQFMPFPLSDIQQAYWIGRQENFELGNVATHIYSEIDYFNIDLLRFEKTIQKLLDRHPMLSVKINDFGEQQFTLDNELYVIDITDISHLNYSSKEEKLLNLREEISHQILNPSKRLFEIKATIVNETKTRIHFSYDALIGDAWSLLILKREFEQLYNNENLILPKLDINFRDYMMAESVIKKSSLYAKSKEYWKGRINEIYPSPELPISVTAHRIESPRYKNYTSIINAEKWTLLKRISTKFNLTPTNLLLGAFSEVLATWSKSPKFTINLTLFNRLPLHPQINDIVGDFTSSTLLSVDLNYKITFVDRLVKLQAQLIKDLEYRFFSGIEVIRELLKTGEANTSALMPVVFTSTISFNEPEDLTTNIIAEEVFSSFQTSQVWLDNQVGENNGALTIVWTVVDELFPEGMVQDMFQSYCLLLEMLVEEKNWRIVFFNLVPDKDIDLFKAINNTSSYLGDESVLNLIEKNIALNPHKIAIQNYSKDISYLSLSLHANKVSNWLTEKRTKSGELVAVLMEKGWEQVAATLGIMRSGAAFIPIDINWPIERILLLLRSGEVKQIITQEKLIHGLNLPDTYNILAMNGQEYQDIDSHYTWVLPSNDNLVYVIFTSGSTGEPKGVMIDYEGMNNTILDINQRFQISPADKILGVSSLSFDLSVYDIFGVLSAGGTLIIPDYSVEPNPSHWIELIENYKITVWNSAPALMEALIIMSDDHSDLTSLRLIMMSGDWIPVSLPDRIWEKNKGVQIISLGGATEVSIWSIIYDIKFKNDHWKSIPYGKPMANQQFYVLNDILQPRPVWVSGELYISGKGLAKGYWKDNTKTSERFITHPVTKERLYKTGDWGKYMPDGNIEFLGREDSQIKIKGYRIELGEIEESLRLHPSVKEVVIAVSEDARRNKQLCAYYVLDALTDTLSTNTKGYSNVSAENQSKIIYLNYKNLNLHIGDNYKKNEVTFYKLRQIMMALSQLKIEELPLPKYLYPSAGGLYPVQTYLYIKHNLIPELKWGGYYYDPSVHQLIPVDPLSDAVSKDIFLSTAISESLFSIFFVANLNAITPVYGDLSIEFCLLEAGYMVALLSKMASDMQIQLKHCYDLKEDILNQYFKLPQEHVLLHGLICSNELSSPEAHSLTADYYYHKQNSTETLHGTEKTKFKFKQEGLRVFPDSVNAIKLIPQKGDLDVGQYRSRQSFRSFQEDIILFDQFDIYLNNLINAIRNYPELQFSASLSLPFNIYIFIKGGRVQNVDEGLYYLNTEDCTLSLSQTEFNIDSEELGQNQSIFIESAFAILFTSEFDDQLSLKLQERLCYIKAGILGQLIMQFTENTSIGVCPIGQINLNPDSTISNHILIHSFLGGKISESQLSGWSMISEMDKENTMALTLRKFLEERLPSYMIPSFYHEIYTVPLSANGKINRNALPEPHRRDSISKDFVPPKTAVEKKIAGIWNRILNEECIGLSDNFFELGGDSLRATQVISHIYKELNVKLQLRTLYNCPNIESLSQEIEAMCWALNSDTSHDEEIDIEKIVL